ncbi:MAG: LPS export ABC transporter permease LptF [Alphaproteobacteria bacterium]|nr:LPS export ABC transporter permease LptF [Alphaproteobacteria bacterium]
MSSSFLYDRYILKNLVPATLFVSVTLAAIIMLTQSLKFLELIIEAGASSSSFWTLTFLALPRFFEVILPVALMISTVFIYNRLSSDSEIVVMRAAGKSPMQLARPALILALLVTFALLFITTWLAPVSLNSMVKMRQIIRAQYSTLLFREGVFNSVGNDFTVYISNRNSNGELEGLLIHDSRADLPAPVTITAKRGIVVATDEGQQVLVYDGSRQDFNEKTGALNRLDFERYTIDLPEASATRQRPKDPDERTISELLHPDLTKAYDRDHQDKFIVEIHRRILGPFLSISFTSVALCFLLLGPVSRRGQTKRIFITMLLIVVIQGLYLGSFNVAAKNIFGLIFMYSVVLVPIVISLFLISRYGEKIRHRYLFRKIQNKNFVNGGA